MHRHVFLDKLPGICDGSIVKQRKSCVFLCARRAWRGSHNLLGCRVGTRLAGGGIGLRWWWMECAGRVGKGYDGPFVRFDPGMR